MACPCDNNRTVVDFMANVKTKRHPVVTKLLDALTELDKLTVTDAKEQQMINVIRQKIETVTAFTNVRIPDGKQTKSEDLEHG